MKTLKEIRERIAQIIAEQRAIVDKATEESEGVFSESQEKEYNGLTTEFEKLQKRERITAELEKRESENKEIEDRYVPGDSNNDKSLSDQETRDVNRFSFGKMIRMLIDKTPLEGVEKEMHEEGQRQYRAAGLVGDGGFIVPQVVLSRASGVVSEAERRDLTATDATQGQELVQTSVGSLINRLQSKLVIGQLGATQLNGLVGNIDFPTVTPNDVAVEKTEYAASAESSPTFGTKSISPNRLPVHAEYSRQLLLQSENESIETFLRNDLAYQIAKVMDTSAINGSGSGAIPEGILNTSGIGDVSCGTPNGGAPTFGNVIDLETEVAQDDADIGNLAYLTNTKVRGKLKQTSKAGTEAMFVWSEGATPLNGYRSGVTNLVPSNLVEGASGATLSALIFGNFADLVIGQWGGLEFLVNPYSLDTTGLIRLNVWTFYDVLIRRAQSFAAAQDCITT